MPDKRVPATVAVLVAVASAAAIFWLCLELGHGLIPCSCGTARRAAFAVLQTQVPLLLLVPVTAWRCTCICGHGTRVARLAAHAAIAAWLTVLAIAHVL